MTRRPRPLACPPPGSLFATRLADGDGTRALWQVVAPGRTETVTGEPGPGWPEFADGVHGAVELLVPVAYRPGMTGDPSDVSVQAVVEAVLDPAGEMMRQLAAAAAAGITACVREAYDKGRRDEAAGEQPEPPTCALCGHTEHLIPAWRMRRIPGNDPMYQQLTDDDAVCDLTEQCRRRQAAAAEQTEVTHAGPQ